MVKAKRKPGSEPMSSSLLCKFMGKRMSKKKGYLLKGGWSRGRFRISDPPTLHLGLMQSFMSLS